MNIISGKNRVLDAFRFRGMDNFSGNGFDFTDKFVVKKIRGLECTLQGSKIHHIPIESIFIQAIVNAIDTPFKFINNS